MSELPGPKYDFLRQIVNPCISVRVKRERNEVVDSIWEEFFRREKDGWFNSDEKVMEFLSKELPSIAKKFISLYGSEAAEVFRDILRKCEEIFKYHNLEHMLKALEDVRKSVEEAIEAGLKEYQGGKA